MISNHPAFPWPKGMIYVDWCYSIQVIYFSTVMETSNYLHAVLYQRPFKIKSLNISLNGYVFFIRSNINEHDVQSCFLLWCGWSNSGRSCEKHCLSEFSNRTPACYSSAVNPSYGFATSDSIRQFRCTTVGLVGCSTGYPLYRGQWSDMRSAVDWWLAHRWFWSGGWWNFRNRPRLSNRVWRGRGLEWCCFPLLETRGGSVA